MTPSFPIFGTLVSSEASYTDSQELFTHETNGKPIRIEDIFRAVYSEFGTVRSQHEMQSPAIARYIFEFLGKDVSAVYADDDRVYGLMNKIQARVGCSVLKPATIKSDMQIECIWRQMTAEFHPEGRDYKGLTFKTYTALKGNPSIQPKEPRYLMEKTHRIVFDISLQNKGKSFTYDEVAKFYSDASLEEQERLEKEAKSSSSSSGSSSSNKSSACVIL